MSPSNQYVEILTPQCVGFRRLGLGEVILLGLILPEWDKYPYKRDLREFLHPFPYVGTQGEDGCLCTSKRALARI